MIKMKGLRHREGPHYAEVLFKKCKHKNHHDAGGSVPPAGPYKKGGPVKCRSHGGSVENTPARDMDKGESIGKRGGDSLMRKMDQGHSIGRRASGGPIKRAMGGVGKIRHDEMPK